MFLFPNSSEDERRYFFSSLQQTDLNDRRNFNIGDGTRVCLRSLNVPFCINIMAGGQYNTEPLISLTSLSDKEHFQVKKRNTQEERERIEMHHHDYFEMMYVMQGAVEQHIENGIYQYKKGTACLMNRNTQHFEVLEGSYFLVYLCLSRDFIKDTIANDNQKKIQGTAVYRFFINNLEGQAQYQKDYLEFSPIDGKQGTATIDPLIEDLAQELYAKQPGYSHIVMGLISRILAFFQDEDIYDCNHVKLDSSAEAYIFNEVTNYLEKNNGKISRTALAAYLNYSSDYINRVIKKHSGMNISEYNQRICLKKAEGMLVNTKNSISDIISSLGFQNKTHFYKLFYDKYGMTPLEYRKQYSSILHSV